ncbi:hypothetical protein [Desulfobacula toluolica]|uniref:hypothetical protein n=1 Tax=Desulfobacula toluolica TaxID=28223 RepID=UPI0002E0F8F9|nr:hypothetical protein [Desulfobacula toluolica]
MTGHKLQRLANPPNLFLCGCEAKYTLLWVKKVMGKKNGTVVENQLNHDLPARIKQG